MADDVKKFRCTLRVADVPKLATKEESGIRWFTDYFVVSDITWRMSFAIRKAANGLDHLDFGVHCYQETRAAFEIKTKWSFKIVHFIDETIEDLSHWDHVSFMNNSLNDYTNELIDIEELDYGFYDDEERFTVEFQLSVIQKASNILPRPLFTEPVKYANVYLVTADQSFFVSSNILRMRSRRFDAMFVEQEPRRRGSVYIIVEDPESFEQFLKLIYFYQDDVNASNVESLLELSDKYQSQECTEILERYLLRTTQVNILDKLTLAQKFNLQHLMAVSIKTIESREKYLFISEFEAFQKLPTAVRTEIRAQSFVEPLNRYDVFLSVNTDPMNPEMVRSQVERYKELSFCMNATITTVNDQPCHLYTITVGGCDAEYFMLRMTIQFYIGQREATTHPVHATIDSNSNSIITPMQIFPHPVAINVIIRIDDFRKSFHGPRNSVFAAPTKFWNAIILADDVEFFVNMEVLASASERFAKLFENSFGSHGKRFRLNNISSYWFEECLQHLYHPGRAFKAETYTDLLVHLLKIDSRRVMEEIDFYVGRTNICDVSKNVVCQLGMLFNTLLILTRKKFGTNGLLDVSNHNYDLQAMAQLARGQ